MAQNSFCGELVLWGDVFSSEKRSGLVLWGVGVVGDLFSSEKRSGFVLWWRIAGTL